jgi:hypothetical protein
MNVNTDASANTNADANTNARRTELRPISGGGRFADWMRRAFSLSRSAPHARVIAEPQVHLGQSLEVEWRLERGAPEITLVTVALVGSEVAHRRISARTGISIVTQRSPFLSLEIDRRAPDGGAPVVSGRGAAVVPTRTVPTLSGKLNEIGWAVVVEASFQAETILRQEFLLLVLPVAP